MSRHDSEAKMGNYGRTAVLAVHTLQRGEVRNPRTAWETAVQAVMPSSVSSQEKGCPRDAFLGICEEGLVKGVSAGGYTKSSKNKAYAVRAYRLLSRDPRLADNERRLWRLVLGGESKAHNQQMDVVVSLWNAGLLKREAPEV
jgi:hypothetical protein